MNNDNFFDMFISYNESKTEAYLNIRPNTRFDKENLKESLKEAYSKVKTSLLYSEISYGIAEDKNIIQKLKEYLTTPEQSRRSKIYQYIIAKGKEPINGVDSQLEIYIDLNREKVGLLNEATGKVDHRELGFSSKIVTEDTPLIKLTKPTSGEEGIAVTGEIIQPAYKGEMKHKIKYDKKSISEIDGELEIIYSAIKTGFLYKDDTKGYFIDEKVLVKSIDYTIGNIHATGVDGASVVVQGDTDVTKDAIKPGFKLESKNINVTGNVGVEACLSGENIIINGIADKNSKIYGSNVEIKRSFNNFVKGKEIKIEEVNGAEIYGESIFINNSIFSQIRGREIFIDNESRDGNYVTDKFIFIKTLCGNANQKITIDSLCSEDTLTNYNQLKDERNKLLKEIESLQDDLKKNLERLNKLDIAINSLILTYFKFSQDRAEEQKKAVKKFIAEGNWSFLEDKFKINFALHDIDKLDKYFSLFTTVSNMNLQISQLKQKIEDMEINLRGIEDSNRNAVVVVLNHKISYLTIEIAGVKNSTLTIKDDIFGSYFVTFKNLYPELKKFDKSILKQLEALLSQDSFKHLKKIL